MKAPGFNPWIIRSENLVSNLAFKCKLYHYAWGQDEKQMERYGDNAGYKAWVEKSGSLFYKNWY